MLESLYATTGSKWDEASIIFKAFLKLQTKGKLKIVDAGVDEDYYYSDNYRIPTSEPVETIKNNTAARHGAVYYD